jgi:sugar O-acyltransferase (sialic acid O-acetyltransferase NeuD family)
MHASSEKQPIVLFGGGEMAEVIRYYFTHDSIYDVVALTVDREHAGEISSDLPVVPFDEIESRYPPDRFKMFVALSYRSVNQVRARKYAEAREKGYTLVSYVNSKSTTWPDLSIGDNCFIFENNVIQPFVKIGSDVILWSGNHIGHHSTIHDHCFLASHIVVSGGVTIEPLTFIGVNATLRDHVRIAAECVIGAGALILKDTNPKEVYVGVAAQLHTRSSDQLRKI